MASGAEVNYLLRKIIALSVVAIACGTPVPAPPGAAATGNSSNQLCPGCPMAGFYCRLSTNTCEPGCGFDSDCEKGLICVNSACYPGCRTDEGCALGSYCSAGACRTGCRSSTSCPSGQTCDTVAGKCVATCTSHNQCPVDSQCASGFC